MANYIKPFGTRPKDPFATGNVIQLYNLHRAPRVIAWVTGCSFDAPPWSLGGAVNMDVSYD
jgi:hypothetical protein